MQRSLAIKQPVRNRQGVQLVGHETTNRVRRREAIAGEDSPGAVVAASGGGGRHR